MPISFRRIVDEGVRLAGDPLSITAILMPTQSTSSTSRAGGETIKHSRNPCRRDYTSFDSGHTMLS